MSTLYVLAITRDTPQAFEFDGHLIEFAPVGGVVAAFERVAQRPSISEAALRMQHQLVLRIAGEVNEILPVRFGAFLDRAELERVLTMRRDAIRQALDLVRGRVQMTIRLSGEASQAPAAPQSRGALTGTAYLEGRRAAAHPPRPPAALAVSAAVRHLVLDERSDSRGPESALYHLIDRNHVAEYHQLLAGVASSTTAVSGPWPPFAFAPDLWS
jgi:hypothetical protein